MIERNSVNYYDHPVFHPLNFNLMTPMMGELKEVVTRWVWTGSTGGIISGMSRAGKTRAVMSLANSMRTRGNISIPSYYISIPRRDLHTITSIFRTLCYSVNLRVTNNDRSDHLSDRFIHYVLDALDESDCDQAILFVDEMQRLVPDQFDAFAELYDTLSKFQIALTTLFIGNNPECWKLIDSIDRLEKSHIRGRFFTHGHVFKGLTSSKQVAECLKQYDTMRYPENGETYVAYFMGESFDSDWKLESLSHPIWEGFESYKKLYGLDSWGMQYFTVTVNTLLCDYLPRIGVKCLDEDVIDECIRMSGLIPSLVHQTT